MALTMNQRVVNFFGNSMKHAVIGERIVTDAILEHHHLQDMCEGVAVYPIKIPRQDQFLTIHVAMVMPPLDKELYNNILLECQGRFSLLYANTPADEKVDSTPDPKKKLFSGSYINKPK